MLISTDGSPLGGDAADARTRLTRTPCTTSVTYSLFLVFGIGSWLTVNGLFAELPLLVAELPEGWRLGSVLAVAVQFANAGPLLYYGARRLALWRDPTGAGEERLAAAATYGVILLGAVSMFGLALYWPDTVRLGSAEHSVPLILLAFSAAFADCTSSLLFWRFASAFQPLHVSALAAGEGLSGAVASGLAWLQGASREKPGFSAGVYFLLLGAFMGASCVAFHVLRSTRSAKAERRRRSPTGEGSGLELGLPLAPGSHSGELHAAVNGCAVQGAMDERVRIDWGADMIALLALQAWLNVLQNGVSVSCLGLASKPYGRDVYQLAQTIALFVDPLAAALGFRLHAGPRALLLSALFLGVVYGYIVALSLEAVTPPLLLAGGGALLVVVSSVGRAMTAYTKMRSNVLLQAAAPRGLAGAVMMWSGIAMQSGACVGSLVMYVLINGTPLFRSGT